MKNPGLVKAFTAARKFIKSNKEVFICLAICEAYCCNQITETQSNSARDLIQERLGWFVCECWIIRNVPGLTSAYLFHTDEGKQQMKDYRLRWLDALIKEFS